MSVYEKMWLHSYCMVVGVITIILFLHAFFPMVWREPYNSSFDDIPSEVYSEKVNISNLYHNHVNKIVLMVIDAFRVDFINSVNGHHLMPYTASSLGKKEAFLMTGQVQTPTVTMPRIKALTTGSIPGFIDVIHNLGSAKIEEDNLIVQSERAGRPVVFYGDETWLKLFPNNFLRKEGTTSFFVSDFVEVDHNVTRHLEKELKANDWKTMILHYLGLDHIGHLEGPKSTLVKPKLKEMDDVIEKIYSSLQNWNRIYSEKSLLIVCGDHGMKDSGGHGGASLAETTVPVIIFGLEHNATNARYFENNLISQVDIAPTLSVLTGLPIPKNSIGKLIPQMVANIPIDKRLFAFYYNSKQVVDSFMNTESYETKDAFLKFQEAVRLHTMWLKSNCTNFHVASSAEKLYISSLHSMSEELSNSSLLFDMPQLVIAVLIQFQLFCFLVFASKFTKTLVKVTQCILCMCIFSFLNVLYCLSSEHQSNLCLINMNYVVQNVFIVIVLSINTPMVINSFSSSLISQVLANQKLFWVVLGSVLQCMSLLSSSFIEEEHQVWYFIWTTFLLLIVFKQCQYSYNSGLFKLSYFGPCLSFVVCHRILRKLNHTGDKWAFLPDISDWLIEPQNKLYLSLVLILGLVGNYKSICHIKWLFSGESNTMRLIGCLLCLIMLASIYLFRAATGTVLNWWIKNVVSKGFEETTSFWFILTLFVGKQLILFTPRGDGLRMQVIGNAIDLSLTIWILLSSLLHRAHNVLLLSMQTWGSFLLGSFYQNTFKTKDDTRWLTFSHYWLGMVFYFYQGNSNSLATIDVAAGYVGLQEYQPVIVGIFLAINTFSAPVFSILLLFAQIYLAAKDRGFHWLWTHVGVAFHTLICHRLGVVTLSCVLMIIHRYHLFIWSVFSPKLLYESMHTLIQFVIILVINFLLIIVFKCFPQPLGKPKK